MAESALSNAQLRVLCTMYVHDCAAMFLTFAAQGHYRNRHGAVRGVPTPNRQVLLALEKRGLVCCFFIARREIFEFTDKGHIFMAQPERIGEKMNDKLLTKREIQAILLTRYRLFQQGRDAGHFTIEVWQQKPRTDVKVCTTWRGIKFCDVGFASLNYKDTWDTEYGVQMAVHKAIAAIAKRIAHGRGPFARCEVLLPPTVVPVECAECLRTQVDEDLKNDVERLREETRVTAETLSRRYGEPGDSADQS